LKGKFFAAGPIDGEDRRPFKTESICIEMKRLAIGAKNIEEMATLLFREPKHAELGQHHRPAEYRRDKKEEDDDLPRQGRSLERVEEPSRGEHVRRNNRCRHAIAIAVVKTVEPFKTKLCSFAAFLFSA
jgi:hypothetical protein